MDPENEDNGTGDQGGSESVRETLERTQTEMSQQQQQPQQPADVEMPADFDDDGKKLWPTLAPEARGYFAKRHKTYGEETTKLRGEYDGFKKTWDPVLKLMEPHAESLKQNNITPQQVVERYIKAEMFLQQDPVRGLAWLMNRYKVTPEQIAEAIKNAPQQQQQQQGQQPKQLDPNDPRDKAILDLQAAAKRRDEDENRQREATVASARKEFEETKDEAGNLKFPYATDPEVRRLMGGYFQTGQVLIEKAGGLRPALEQAYDMAVHAHKPSREALTKAQNEAEAKKKAEEEKKRVEKAKRLGQSVTGSSTPGSAGTPPKGRSVRETMVETSKQIGFNS